MSSITFFGDTPFLAPYVASKGALVGLTRALARECGADGITVNAIAPGAFPTAAEAIHPDLPAYNQFILDQQAVKRRGEPADIANAVLFLAAPEIVVHHRAAALRGRRLGDALGRREGGARPDRPPAHSRPASMMRRRKR